MAKYTAEQRRELAAKGKALPDGSYPIDDRADLENAIHAVGRGGTPHEKIRNHIRKRARELNATGMLPDTWAVYELEPYDPTDLGDEFGLDLHDIEARARAHTFANTLAERLARDDGLDQVGTWGANLHGVGLAKPSAAHLTEYWTVGKGAQEKIHWGTDGAITRCIRHLRGKVRSPGGLCADYHKIATGEWPTEHGEHGIPS